MQKVFKELKDDLAICPLLDSVACGKGVKCDLINSRRSKKRNLHEEGEYEVPGKIRVRKAFTMDDATSVLIHMTTTEKREEVIRRVRNMVSACRKQRVIADESVTRSRWSSDACRRFTSHLPLEDYKGLLRYLPRLVNVVTMAELVPSPNSKASLPVDLRHIACSCNGVFFAPNKFAAVQLAYAEPRCRILVFHTGRIVGTGCTGIESARLGIANAQAQLATEAGLSFYVRNFHVINQVAAVDLKANFNTDAFAEDHKAESHFDRDSFVGLTWRPPNESCCIEIYSTGKANLPGAKHERDIHATFRRMLPELLRYSSSNASASILPTNNVPLDDAESDRSELSDGVLEYLGF